MFTSAELIEALRRKGRRSLRPETPAGEFPPGWRAWFAAMRERMGAITGAGADAIVAIFLQREPRRPPPREPELASLQAFATLWRQQWHPAAREERGRRIVAFTIAALMQVVFAILLLWLAYARYGGAPQPAGEEIVQVEYIGEGTPRDEGGGAPAGAAPQPAAAAAASARTASPKAARAAPAAASASAQPAPRGEAPSPPAPAVAAAAQPVQVTEAAQPDQAFVLPPPQVRDVTVPQARIEVPQLAQAPESLQAVTLPSPVTAKVLQPKLPGAHVEVPALGRSVEALPSPAPPLPGVAAVEAHVPAARVSVPALGTAPESLPAPAAPLPGVAESSVALPEAKIGVPGLRAQAEALPGTVGMGAESPSASQGTAAVAGGSGTPQGGATDRPDAGAGAGPKRGTQPGAWSTAKAGTDWGASDRNRPGGQSGGQGLFDENGRVRLPPGTSASAESGTSPDVVTEEIGDLDRAGTWLKRKSPLPYSPTAFDRYWLPGGTLLQEWVRRGIREVQISIPGTSKKLHCVVSLLQLGGGCGIDDPDMQDQEATARKPPDVPFKPELQGK